MTDKLNSVVIGEIVAKAMQDETLKKALIADPAKVLAESGIAAGSITYKVVEDSDVLKNIILPSEPLSNAMKLDTLQEGASPAQITRYIITKAQADKAYAKRVVNDIDTVLKDLGISLPPGISLNIVANTAATQYIVIPYSQPSTGELSDEQLTAVAGGKSSSSAHVHTSTDLYTNAVAATQVAEAAEIATTAAAAAEVAAGAVAVAVVVIT